MGKTKEAEAAASSVRAIGIPVSLVYLGGRAEPGRTLIDLVSGETATRWRAGQEWHIFIDGVDEAPGGAPGFESDLRAFLQALVAEGGPLNQLRLRLLCRTVEWVPSLEGVLNLIWTDEEIRKYQITPLSTADVRQAVDITVGDSLMADRFIEAAERVQATALTSRPVSLRLLTDLFIERGDFPLGQGELYQRGLEALLEERESIGRARVRRGAVHGSERLSVAARIAAATSFSGLSTVWVGTEPGAQPTGSFRLQEISGGYEPSPPISFPVSEQDLLEVLRSPLFVAVAPDVYGWAHQTFAEFLTARYLLEHGLSAAEVFEFLSVDAPGGGAAVAPQLREIAAWAATASPMFFRHLLEVEPDILLQSDVAAVEPVQRERLVAALLEQFDQGNLVDIYFGLSQQFNRLGHEGLSAQLRTFLENTSKTDFARQAAIDMAEANHLSDLAAPLALLVLSPVESNRLRKDAAYAVARMGDATARSSLKTVLSGDLGSDLDDELKGAVLSATWPEHLSIDALLSVLTPRKESNFIGHYAMFQHRLMFGHMSVPDALGAIAWLRNQLPVAPDDFSWRGVLSRVFWAAASRLDDAAVRSSLASFILDTFEEASNWIYSDDPAEVDEGGVAGWGGDASDRLALVLALVEDANVAIHVARLVPHTVARLILPTDLPLYLPVLQKETDNLKQEALAEIIVSLSRHLPIDSLDYVWTAAEKIAALKSELLSIYYIFLDSHSAKWMRDADRRKSIAAERDLAAAQGTAIADEKLHEILEQIESGSAEAWWQLNLQLFVSDSGRFESSHEFRSDLKATPGWSRLNETDRNRIMDAASRYLTECHLKSLRWLGTTSHHRPAAAAVRALRLLFEDRPTVFSALPPNVWVTWAPAIISFFENDAGASAGQLEGFASQAYTVSPGTVERALARMALGPKSEGLPARPLELLGNTQSERLGDFLDKLRKRPNRKRTREAGLYPFLIEMRRPATARALLEALSAPDPQSALSADGPLSEGTQAAAVMLRQGSHRAWAAVLALRERDSVLARAIWTEFAQQTGFRRSPAPLDQPEETLGHAYLDLKALFPAQLETSGGARFISDIDYVERLQSAIINRLVSKGTASAVTALQKISDSLPEAKWLSGQVQEARRNYRAAARRIRAPADILAQIAMLTVPLPPRDEVKAAQVSLATRSDEKPILQPNLYAEPPTIPAPSGKRTPSGQKILSILAVATEWRSNHGGLSTLNRELCVALAALGHEVCCVVLDPTDQDVAGASADNVKLIRCPEGVGYSGDDRLLLVRRRHLISFRPDVVFGHDHVTGHAALQMAQDLEVPYVHILHTVPEESEGLKGRSAGPGRALLRGDDKANSQLALSREAKLVVGIGPKICSSIALRLPSELPVVEITPGLNSALLTHEPSVASLPRSYGLMSARMQDGDLKGAKLACNSFRKAGLEASWPPGSRPWLVLRGFTPDAATEEFERAIGPFAEFDDWIQTRAYTDNSADMYADIKIASIVLMPSRTEGFGLAGYEAIAAAVPVVVSIESGLAEYLLRAADQGDIDSEVIGSCIADVVGDATKVTENWAEKVSAILLDRPAAFQRARSLRLALMPKLTWQAAAETFTQSVIDIL